MTLDGTCFSFDTSVQYVEQRAPTARDKLSKLEGIKREDGTQVQCVQCLHCTIQVQLIWASLNRPL